MTPISNPSTQSRPHTSKHPPWSGPHQPSPVTIPYYYQPRRRFRDDLDDLQRQQRARNPHNAEMYADYYDSDEEGSLWIRAPSRVRVQTPVPRTPFAQRPQPPTTPAPTQTPTQTGTTQSPVPHDPPTFPTLPNSNPIRCQRILNAYITASRHSRNLPPIPETASAHEVYNKYYTPDLNHIFRFIKTGPYADELTHKEEDWMRWITLSVLSHEWRDGEKIRCGCGFLMRVCLLEK
jgi:hypothetical protein